MISEGHTVTEVAAQFGVSHQTIHAWLAKYEAGGIEGLGDGSHRPRSCPHQMSVEAEVVLAELRRAHPSWGPRRLVFELANAVLIGCRRRLLRPRGIAVLAINRRSSAGSSAEAPSPQLMFRGSRPRPRSCGSGTRSRRGR